ncbi:MAG: hypothetical protein EA397_04915 [Deltaproteobacteria bacterium]|nr:MAG: hypothetical protein EA397_04915 [Deltaproteobacteria bacterium]
MRALIFSFLMLLGACDPENDGDPDDSDPSGPHERPVESDTIRGCAETYIVTDGPEIPQVGLSWNLVMRCIYEDETQSTLGGPMIVSAQPHHAVQIQDNKVTFLEAGELTLRMQVGAYRERMDVLVLE